MIEHHRVLYRDLADPEPFFRAPCETELAHFWPYVFGAQQAEDPEAPRRYSTLMSDSQALIAQETLALSPLRGVRHLMDLGGGQGVFLRHAAAQQPGLKCTLFDLPQVVAGAVDLPPDTRVLAGSFSDDPLPRDADAISLIRVLYDHDDETIAALLARVHDALPEGGRVLISEPMLTGGRATDVYFAIYTLAMGTGRTRSPAEICGLLERAGFSELRVGRTRRKFITEVITARRK